MSTILKALKQSEARRPREASLPGSLPAVERVRRSSPLPWLTAGAAAVLAVAAAAWWFWQPGGAGAPAAPSQPRHVAEVSLPDRPAAAERAPDPAAPPEAQSAEADDTGARSAEAVQAETAEAGDAPPAQADGPESAEAAPAQPADGAPGQGEEVAPEPETALAAHAMLPRLKHLPASRREALPTLTVNAHVYVPEPERRFVLINLSRYREGERVAPGLTVAEIFPGGVVMEDAQGRFVLPRP